MKTKRITALLLCVLSLLAMFPVSTAFAAENTVTIESEYNGAFDYLEYYSNGEWKDLNTPQHVIEQTGEIVYCVEHSAGNPHGDTYTAASPSSVFSVNTVAGLNAIFLYGYPNNCPSGFTADEARQATANAIRFWLSEQGEDHSYNFTNRRANPGSIRAKSGYGHVLTWADQLLEKARAKSTMDHAISFSPATVELAPSGSNFTGSTKVTLTNINSGYALSGIPSGITVSGHTGSKTETITFTAPASLAGATFTVTATGKDTRSIKNITAYIPADGSKQKIFLCATTAQVVATAQLKANVPAFGKIKITKNGEDGAKLAGVKFGIYSDSACRTKIAELTTDSDGTVTSGDLTIGTYYVKELNTISPYILAAELKSAKVTANTVKGVSFSNSLAKGKIRVEKKAEQVTSLKETSTEYGKLYTPKYSLAGLKGVVFEVKNASGTIVATLTTNADGIAETGELPLGTYTVQEKSTVKGFLIDDAVHTVTLAYKDQTTPVVSKTVSVENTRQKASLSLKKITEQFNYKNIEFEQISGMGYVFGVFSAENIGIIPKDTMVDMLTTNEMGEAESNVELPCGNYYLKELYVPDPTVHMIEDKLPLSLEGEAEIITNTQYSTTPIVNDMFKANIAVYKFDEDGTTPLAGAVYELRDEDGLRYCTMTTDEFGYAISIPIPVGSYRLREIKPPTGYILSDEVISVTLTTADKATAVFERTNKANELTLKKTDIVTGEPVPGATIEIYDAQGGLFHTAVTNESGEIYLKAIPSGSYTLKETISPDGYALNTEIYEFTMDDYGKVTGITEITNAPITLTLKKINTYTGEPFPNIEFFLKDSEGNIVKTKSVGTYRIAAEDGEDTFRVDENGYAEFRYLHAGSYTIEESTPVGYISEDAWNVGLTPAHSISSPYALSIENAPTGLKVRKVKAHTDEPLEGAGFRLKIKDGADFKTLQFERMQDGSYFQSENGEVTDIIVDSTGEFTVLGLPLGSVWIEESIVPEGYFPISAVKVEITKDTSFKTPLEVKIENSKFVKLGMDSDWWEFPALITGIGAAVGVAVYFIIRSKKRKTESEES